MGCAVDTGERYLLVGHALSGRSDDDKENQWEDAEGIGCGRKLTLFELSSSPASPYSFGAARRAGRAREMENGRNGDGEKAGPDESSIVMPVTPKSAGAQSEHAASPPATARQEGASKSKPTQGRMVEATRGEMPTPPATTEMRAASADGDDKRKEARQDTSAHTLNATLVLRDLAAEHLHFKDSGLVFCPPSSSLPLQTELGVLEQRGGSNLGEETTMTTTDGKQGLFVRVERWRWASAREREVAVV